eukprot:gnl/Trimastix_PCT/3803.p2 GENE.gnl/Trimastix_PCT/3803~~gnl/Trimastix_PCT/3803.p2  ORF type:complete len:167 (+),score=50.36 gnl/Trimastix_PCT/3803:87-587(+)
MNKLILVLVLCVCALACGPKKVFKFKHEQEAGSDFGAGLYHDTIDRNKDRKWGNAWDYNKNFDLNVGAHKRIGHRDVMQCDSSSFNRDRRASNFQKENEYKQYEQQDSWEHEDGNRNDRWDLNWNKASGFADHNEGQKVSGQFGGYGAEYIKIKIPLKKEHGNGRV